MALVHLRQASIKSVMTTYNLRVMYETYDTLTDPCTFIQNDFSKILAAAGLSSSLTFSSCSVVSISVIGGVNKYVLEVVVTG